MEIKLIYPRWGSAHLSWSVFLQKVKDNGYTGVEIDLPLGKAKNEILSLLKEYELDFVGQHWETQEHDFTKHKVSFEKHLYNLVEGSPLLINSHTGRDYFSFKQNAELIKIAHQIERETGIIITHETHRSRFSFAAHICYQYLVEFPFLKLTSDFSHWCCVAESLLEDQKSSVDLAIKSTYHIHARVGSAQNPQVIDPRDENYTRELEVFKKWWYDMIANAKKQDRSFISITPEYGPFPYAQYIPGTNKTFVSQSDINQFIKKELSELL